MAFEGLVHNTKVMINNKLLASSTGKLITAKFCKECKLVLSEDHFEHRTEDTCISCTQYKTLKQKSENIYSLYKSINNAAFFSFMFMFFISYFNLNNLFFDTLILLCLYFAIRKYNRKFYVKRIMLNEINMLLNNDSKINTTYIMNKNSLTEKECSKELGKLTAQGLLEMNIDERGNISYTPAGK